MLGRAGTAVDRRVRLHGRHVEAASLLEGLRPVPGHHAAKRRLVDSVLLPARIAWSGGDAEPPAAALLHGPGGGAQWDLAPAAAEALGVEHHLIDIADLAGDPAAVAPGELAGAIVRASGTGRRVVELVGAPSVERPPEWLAAGIEELQRTPFSERSVVFVVTEVPWELPPALCVPGVIECAVFVAPPDWEARHRVLVEGVHGWAEASPRGLERLVAATEGWTGADLTRFAAGIDPAAPIDELVALAASQEGSARSWFESARLGLARSAAQPMFDDLLAYLRRIRAA